jgi:hypothetical protein
LGARRAASQRGKARIGGGTPAARWREAGLNSSSRSRRTLRGLLPLRQWVSLQDPRIDCVSSRLTFGTERRGMAGGGVRGSRPALRASRQLKKLQTARLHASRACRRATQGKRPDSHYPRVRVVIEW